MIGRLINLIGWRMLINLLLLIVTLGSLVWGVASVVPNINRGEIVGIFILGLLTASLLAQSSIQGRQYGVLVTFMGVGGAIIHFSGLSKPMLTLARLIGSIPNSILQSAAWPDLSPLAAAWLLVIQQLEALINRITFWFSTLLRGGLGQDPLVVSFLWGLLIWFITAWAGWAVLRMRMPLPAVTPSGILLAGVLNYSRGNALWLVPMVFTTLILMALSRYEAEEYHWKYNLIDYAEDIRTDLLMIIPILVIMLTILAAFSPSVSIQRIVQVVQEIIEPYQTQADTLAESLGLRDAPPEPNTLGQRRSPGLPQQHLLTAGPELSTQVVMTIQTGDLPPRSSIDLLPNPPVQYYWRALTYDIYTSRGWATSQTELIDYRAGQPAVEDVSELDPAVRTIQQTVQLKQAEEGVLYATGLLITADVDFQVSWRSPIGDSADAFGIQTDAASYAALSQLTTPSIQQLRLARPVYPDWVLARYLSLPEYLPQRVRDLAFDLTRGQPIPYDQASAIESYLRSFPYTLDVPAPPSTRDVADFFLFDLQRGYCDYYATAMVVLSRAAGLPARLVSGYASGAYDPPNAQYVITADNAHSWVEVYFTGIGWVEFEPTGGLPAIERSQEQAALPLTVPVPKPVQKVSVFDWLHTIPWLMWALGLSLFILLVGIVWQIIDMIILLRTTPQRTLINIYQRIRHQGTSLVSTTQPGDTPSEFASRLQHRLARLDPNLMRDRLIIPASGETRDLIGLYNQAMYSHHQLDPRQQHSAIQIWIRLRIRLFIARLGYH